jgi:ribosomal protein S18 acetylase RimI-like enzyme
VTVRGATEADEAVLAELDRRTWSPVVSPAPCPTGTFFDDKGADGVLVAELDGAVVGYVKLRPPTGLASNMHVLAIHGLAVDPDVQRRGVAAALLTAAEREAARRGVRRLTLRVLGLNAVARAVYAKCGYVVEGVQRGEFLLPAGPDGAVVAVDDVLMAKAVVGE